MSQTIRGRVIILIFFSDRPEKKTHLEDDAEFFLSSFGKCLSAVSAKTGKCINTLEAGWQSCFFRSARKTPT